MPKVTHNKTYTEYPKSPNSIQLLKKDDKRCRNCAQYHTEKEIPNKEEENIKWVLYEDEHASDDRSGSNTDVRDELIMLLPCPKT